MMTPLLAIPIRLVLGATLATAPGASVHAHAAHVVAAMQPAATPATPEALDELYTHAQMQVESYNTTGDVAKVRVAHEELSRWLVGHAKIYGYGDAAAQARAPVQQQIASLEQVLASQGPPPPTSATPAAVAPTGPGLTPEQAERRRTYDKLSTWGIVSLSLGGGLLVVGALPAWLLRDRALTNAADESYYVEEQRFIERARRRHHAALAMLGIGCGLAVLGITSIAIGAGGRARLRREMVVAPALGPSFAGASATVRF
jgi:hypothetical protein